MYENKSSEKYGRFIISYAIADNISGKFLHYPKLGYEPSMTGIDGCLAVYSPLRVNALRAFIDGRWDDSPLNKEIIGIVKWTNSKWGNFRTLMKPNDYGYDNIGVGGDIHKIGNEYVLELAGGINYTPPPNKYIKWVNGLVLLDSNFNVKRMLNKVLKDKDGNAVWATFANDGDWFALSRKRGTNDIYLAELVTNGGVKPPTNGGDMEAPSDLGFNPNTKVLSWVYTGEDVDKFDIVAEHNPPHNWIGQALNTDRYFIVPDGFIRGDTQFFKVVAVKGNNKGFSSLFYASHVGDTKPPPDPVDNVAIANEIIELARKIK